MHTPAGYAATFGAEMAQYVGAHYRGGEIHVNGGRALDGAFASLLVHEMVPAFLDHKQTAQRLPLWLNEGLAEYYSCRSRGVTRLQPGLVVELQRARPGKKLWPLPPAGRLSPYGCLSSAPRARDRRAFTCGPCSRAISSSATFTAWSRTLPSRS